MSNTTAGTAGNTPEIERPSFSDVYDDLTGFDDEAVSKHLGFDLESLFSGLNDGSLSDGDRLNAVRACEFLRKRKELADQVPNADAMAAQLVKEMTRRDIGPVSAAYWAATYAGLADDDVPDPESAEGKASPSAEPSAEPSDMSDPENLPTESETSD